MRVKLSTIYEFDCYDAAGVRLWHEIARNLVTNGAKGELLNVFFKGGASPGSAWFLGLVSNASFGGFAGPDTMASHPGWVEYVAYDETTREAFVSGAILGGVLDNAASRAEFTMNAAGSVRGAFMVNNNAKSGTAGLLYGEAAFGIPRSVVPTQILKVKATLIVS